MNRQQLLFIISNQLSQQRQILLCDDAPQFKFSDIGTLFTEKSGYQQLDKRKQLTSLKVLELLLVLEHPELPLHNNSAELAARTIVQRRNISYAT